MAAQKPKVKMISFRLSAEEYALLREAADAAGVGNLSELARSAMHEVLLRSRDLEGSRDVEEGAALDSGDPDHSGAPEEQGTGRNGQHQRHHHGQRGLSVTLQLRSLEEKLEVIQAEFERLNRIVGDGLQGPAANGVDAPAASAAAGFLGVRNAQA